MTEGFPRWVEDEINNGARSQREGERLGPRGPMGEEPEVCEFPPQPDHEDDIEPP